MRFIGGLVGLALALFLWAATEVVIAALLLFAVTLAAYVAGAVATVRLMRSPPAAAALPAHPVESFAGGVMTGSTAGVNVGLWALVPFGRPIGIAVGLVSFLVVFPTVARDRRFQSVLGWSAWLMPYAWLATAFGLLLFLVNLPFALGSLGRRAVRLDVLTGTVELTGGIVGVFGFVGGGFNLGNFSFLSPRPGAGLGIQTPFDGTGLSAHETGHTLSVAGFGGIIHWIGAVDENVPPLRRKQAAYGELIAESHLPAPLPRRHVRVWS